MSSTQEPSENEANEDLKKHIKDLREDIEVLKKINLRLFAKENFNSPIITITVALMLFVLFYYFGRSDEYEQINDRVAINKKEIENQLQDILRNNEELLVRQRVKEKDIQDFKKEILNQINDRVAINKKEIENQLQDILRNNEELLVRQRVKEKDIQDFKKEILNQEKVEIQLQDILRNNKKLLAKQRDNEEEFKELKYELRQFSRINKKRLDALEENLDFQKFSYKEKSEKTDGRAPASIPEDSMEGGSPDSGGEDFARGSGDGSAMPDDSFDFSGPGDSSGSSSGDFGSGSQANIGNGSTGSFEGNPFAGGGGTGSSSGMGSDSSDYGAGITGGARLKRVTLVAEDVQWNTWVEEWTDQRTYIPEGLQKKPLKANSEYRFSLDLSGVNYREDEFGFLDAMTSSNFKNDLKKVLKKTEIHSIDLFVRILFDSAYFETIDSLDPKEEKLTQKLTIDLDKIRKAIDGGITLKGTIIEQLKDEGKTAPFVFGSVDFKLKTLKELPVGNHAAISFSIWSDSIKPLDEISVDFCTNSESCLGPQTAYYGFRGNDSIRASLSGDLKLPDGALHFLEMQNGKVYGIWRDNSKTISNAPEFVVWKVSEEAKKFAGEIPRITKKLFLSKTNEVSRIRNGESLFNLLFPREQPDIRKIFRGFVKNKVSGREPFDANPPSLFVRIVAKDLTPPSLVPLAMISIKDDKKKDSYLGYFFRIETPLPRQLYGTKEECLKNWVIVQPTMATEELGKAISMVSDRVSSLDDPPPRFKIKPDLYANRFITDFNNFADWLSGKNSDESAVEDSSNSNGGSDESESTEEEPTIFSILSHHDEKQLFFSDDNVFDYLNIGLRFQKPSAAILNGCGTGEPGASEMIKKLNEKGVQAAIVTNTTVTGKLAGSYSECFYKQVESSTGSGMSLSDAHYKSLKCLNDLGSFGGRILWYSLIGNGNLKFCAQ